MDNFIKNLHNRVLYLYRNYEAESIGNNSYYDDGILLTQEISLVFIDVIVMIDDTLYKTRSTINVNDDMYISIDSIETLEQISNKLFWKCISYIVNNIDWSESESNVGALFDNARKVPTRKITKEEVLRVAEIEGCMEEYSKLVERRTILNRDMIYYEKITAEYYSMTPKQLLTAENVFSLLRDNLLVSFARLGNLIHVKESKHMQEPTYTASKSILFATVNGNNATYMNGKLEYMTNSAKNGREIIGLDGFNDPVLTYVNLRLHLFCKRAIAYSEIYTTLFMHPKLMEHFSINERTRDIGDSHHMALQYRRDGNRCNINITTLLHGKTSIHFEEKTSHLRLDVIHICASQIEIVVYDILDLFTTMRANYNEIRKISANLVDYRRVKYIEPATIAIENSQYFGKDTTHRTGNQGDAKPIIFQRRQIKDVLVLAKFRFPDMNQEDCIYHNCNNECLTLNECTIEHNSDELIYLSMRRNCSNIVFIKLGSALIPSVRNNAIGTIERHNIKSIVSVSFYANMIAENSENIGVRANSYRSPVELLNRYMAIEELTPNMTLCMQELFDHNKYELKNTLNNIQTFTHFRLLEEITKSNVLVFLESTNSLEIPRYAKYHLRHFRYATTIYLLLDARGNYHLFYSTANKDRHRFKNNKLLLKNLYFSQLLQYNIETKQMTRQKEHITEDPPENTTHQHIDKNGKVIAYVVGGKYVKLDLPTIPRGELKLYYEPVVDNTINLNRMYATRLWSLVRWYWMIERLPINDFLGKIEIVREMPALTAVYENFPKVSDEAGARRFLHRIWPMCFSKDGRIRLDISTARAIKSAMRTEVKYIPEDAPLPHNIEGIYEWMYMKTQDIFTDKDLFEDWLLRRYAKLTCSIYLPIREFSISHGQDLDRYRRFIYRKDNLAYFIVNNSGNNQQRTKASLNAALYIAQMYKRTGKIPPFQDIPPVQYDIGQYMECTLHTLPTNMPRKELVIVSYANNAHKGALLEIFEV